MQADHSRQPHLSLHGPGPLMEILREYTAGRLQEGADDTQPAAAPQNDEIH